MSDAKSTPVDIVIAGASFAGLTAALGFVATLGPGVRVAVLDRADLAAPSPVDARAFALSDGSRQLLTALGVWPLLAGAAQPVAAIDITDSSLDAGVRPIIVSFDNVVDGGRAATHIVPSGALLCALRARVAEAAAVFLIPRAEIAALETGAHAAQVRLADGRAFSASLVIAADGRRSTVRELAGIKTVGWRYGQTGIVTTVAHELPHCGRAVQHFLPAGPFAILPLTGNRACVTWSETEPEAARILGLDDQGFLAELEQRFGHRLGALALAGPRQSWPLDMHLARALIGPRIALVADAAHGAHPIAGQGLNLGLRDVAALIEVVADTARLGLDLGSALGLERYQRWRRSDSALSTAAFDGLNLLFASDWSVSRTLRDAGLGLVDRTPALKRWFVTEAAGQSGEVPRLLRGEPV